MGQSQKKTDGLVHAVGILKSFNLFRISKYYSMLKPHFITPSDYAIFRMSHKPITKIKVFPLFGFIMRFFSLLLSIY